MLYEIPAKPVNVNVGEDSCEEVKLNLKYSGVKFRVCMRCQMVFVMSRVVSLASPRVEGFSGLFQDCIAAMCRFALKCTVLPYRENRRFCHFLWMYGSRGTSKQLVATTSCLFVWLFTAPALVSFSQLVMCASRLVPAQPSRRSEPWTPRRVFACVCADFWSCQRVTSA